MLELRCDRCSSEFSLCGGRRTTVSCPSCGGLLDVQLATMTRTRSNLKVEKVLPELEVIKPQKISGRFRCTQCAKLFRFERDPEDIRERYTQPHCAFCDSPEVVAITPLVAVATVPSLPLKGKRLKVARFVRRNFKALVEIRTYFQAMDAMVKRAALPPKEEARLLRKGRAFRTEALQLAEAHANELLRKRMKELGVADGEAVL